MSDNVLGLFSVAEEYVRVWQALSQCFARERLLTYRATSVNRILPGIPQAVATDQQFPLLTSA
jgi:hypothetical protein